MGRGGEGRVSVMREGRGGLVRWERRVTRKERRGRE